MIPDRELLRRYAESRSEEAFAELVRRHVDLVYSAALRQVGGNALLAQDVAQTVFTDLARKAAAVTDRDSLSGWLYTGARFAAIKLVRSERRRNAREQEASAMRELLRDSTPEPDWTQIGPILDEVMHELKESDREAILLRFFEKRPLAEVGERLGLSENTARMRVERALEKLRGLLARRGFTSTVTLASVLSANAVHAAPSALVASIASASVAAAGTGGAVAFSKLMLMTKLKFAFGALVVTGGVTVAAVQHQLLAQEREQNQALSQEVARLQDENARLPKAPPPVTQSLSDAQMEELLRLRGEVGVLRSQVRPDSVPRVSNQPLTTATVESKAPLKKKVVVNLAGTQGTRYALAEISVIGDENINALVEKFDEELRDAAASVLSAKTVADLDKPDAQRQIREELTSAFSQVLGGGVKGVLLSEFAIQ